MRKLMVLIVLGLFATEIYGAGFRVALQATKQQGMGHVGAGTKVGPSNIFFNPGALALLESGGITLSGSAIFGDVKYAMPGTEVTSELEDNIGTPFGAYGSFNIGERFAAGLGVYTPYGNTVEWPDDWAGRIVSQNVNLKAIFLQPTLSFALNDKLGIGGGLTYVLGDVVLERAIPLDKNDPNSDEADIMLETDGFANGIGYNVGIFYEPTNEMSLGLNYRSKVDVSAEEGIVSFEDVPNSAATSFAATKWNAELPLPGEVAFGVGFRPSDRLLLAADMNYILWSQYKKLELNFNGNVGGNNVTSSITPQDWKDAFTMKIGGEYDINEKFDLRAGAYYDFSPVPDKTLAPITPDSDRIGLTGGLSFMPNDKLSVDAAVLLLLGKQRTVQAEENQFGFGQTYLNTVTAPSIGLNYSFN